MPRPRFCSIPGRLKISWQDGGDTLRIDTDAGLQTRLLHLSSSAPPAGEDGWQGYSADSWEYANGFDPAMVSRGGPFAAGGGPPGTGGGAPGPGGSAPPGGGRGRGRGSATTPDGGDLKVVTTHLKPGYLRRNGVPFSKDAVLTEYFNIHHDPYGMDWMIVTAIVHDPTYLFVDYITSTNFKREADGSKWRPRPSSAQ